MEIAKNARTGPVPAFNWSECSRIYDGDEKLIAVCRLSEMPEGGFGTKIHYIHLDVKSGLSLSVYYQFATTGAHEEVKVCDLPQFMADRGPVMVSIRLRDAGPDEVLVVVPNCSRRITAEELAAIHKKSEDELQQRIYENYHGGEVRRLEEVCRVREEQARHTQELIDDIRNKRK
jgi:hypothetical protein